MRKILPKERLNKGLYWSKNWPIAEGCTHCSPACDNCFAAEYAHRFAGSLPYLKGLTDENGKWNGTVRMREDQIDLPLRTKKPTVWFVAERSDLFHPAVDPLFVLKAFDVMSRCPHHRFMVLTKRPEHMAAWAERFPVNGLWYTNSGESWPDNVWAGTTAWDHASAERNIQHLLRTPAAHRFVSVEPMLGPINLEIIRDVFFDAGMPVEWQRLEKPGIDWVICGGESGRKARPVHPDWVRSLRDQCAAACVPFFLKQMHICGRLEKAPLLDGAQHLEFPHA